MYQAAGSIDQPPDPGFLAATIDAVRAIGHGAFLGANLAYLAELQAAAGDLRGALDIIDDALVTVDRSGENLHRPELLRRRVAHRRALVGASPGDAVELIAAFDLADDKGLDLIALRSAIDVAGLPDAERPEAWRQMLEKARNRLPAGSTLEATRADEILGR
jgi:hypothetical protein